LGYGIGVVIQDAKFKGSLKGVSGTGGIVGSLDQLSIDSPNLITRAKVIATGTGVTGRVGVGGIYGSNYNTVVTDALVMGPIGGTSSVGGVSGGGCGNTINRAAIFSAVVAQSNVGGIDGSTCVLTVKDSMASGTVTPTVNGSGSTVAGLLAGGYLKSYLSTSYSSMKINVTPTLTGAMLFGSAYSTSGSVKGPAAPVGGIIGNYVDASGAIGGVATNLLTVNSGFYRVTVTTGLMNVSGKAQVDPIATPLDDSAMTDSSKFQGFNFNYIWKMPTQVPAGVKLAPIPKWVCGQEGFVCP
jgi:hypothetical protein